MITSTAQAIREIEILFRDAWADTGPIDYPNIPFSPPDDRAQEWACFRVQHAEGGQRTLAGQDGKSRHESLGNVVIETYTPAGKGLAAAYELADIVLDAFRGKRTPSDVWFRNVRMIEVGDVSKLWFQIDIVADFTYEALV